MSIGYKVFQSLSYEVLNWSFDKGKKVERKRLGEQKRKRDKEIRNLINERHFNRYCDKHWDELLEEVRKVEYYEDFDEDDYFI